MYLAQKPAEPSDLVIPEGESGPPKIIDGTGLGNNGTVFNYCYAIMRLEGPKLSIDYYEVDSTDAQPGSPPPLGQAIYSEAIEKTQAAQ
jgi:hypothetical protein